jgi:hypothetical protein
MSLPDAAPLNEPPPAAAATTAFDLDAYIGRYAPGSETRIQRLTFIATHATDEFIQQSALRLLESQLKESGNTVRYQQVFSSSAQTNRNQDDPDDHDDDDWLTNTAIANEAALEVLEARLLAAQAHLNKDAIRTAYLNMGDFLLQKGQLRDALRNVQRARDYCTSRPQTLAICWKVIELAMNTCMLYIYDVAVVVCRVHIVFFFGTVLTSLVLYSLSYIYIMCVCIQPTMVKFVIT